MPPLSKVARSRFENLVSLRPLQIVADALREVASGRTPDTALKRRATRQVRAAGASCVPLLMRALRDPDEVVSRFAAFLAARVGGGRIVREVYDLLCDPDVSDDAKARGLELLGELHVPPPAEISLRDPDRVIERSVRDLL